MNAVCVDAGLVVKLISPEDDSPLAEALFSQWKNEDTKILAPAFALAEIDSVLRQKVLRGEIPSDVADESFNLACRLPIEIDSNPSHRRRAWEIAKTFAFPTVYDSVYLALAEDWQCEFWTADEGLFKKVRGEMKFIRFLRT